MPTEPCQLSHAMLTCFTCAQVIMRILISLLLVAQSAAMTASALDPALPEDLRKVPKTRVTEQTTDEMADYGASFFSHARGNGRPADV